MNRFYTEHDISLSKVIHLTDKDEVHHIKNVLRLKPDQNIFLFNGQNIEAEAKILTINKNAIQLSIEKVQQHEVQYPLITLVCAIPKKSKFELIIEKATEAGAHDIIPVITDHSDIKVKTLTAVKTKRYNTVALNAAKQSQRYSIPEIHAVGSLKKVVESLYSTHALLVAGLNGERQSILKVLPPLARSENIALFIGPEGDFSRDEYAFMRENSAQVVSLGQNVLKVETAAITAVAIAQAFFHP
ncbi:MAG: 16S rRNA (uracil(1498)-N(3))-methyltransferase [Candidatus Omnitrophica bacterium]|nr:16S rRNA (uracil(1498)-N(3))-methyltransferase [Candidatus Omnitrophota bacterium]